MLATLEKNPILLLFGIAALGYLLGRVNVFGVRLGVAAVLFVGLAAGATSDALKIPEIVQTFGLVLFVYTVGLSSGPAFFASFKRRGLAINGAAFGLLGGAAVLAAALAHFAKLSKESIVGLFCGALTNTPALASVVEALERRGASSSAPVVAYSLAYPFGVLGVVLAMALLRRRGARAVPKAPDSRTSFATMTVRVGPEGSGRSIGTATEAGGGRVVFSRVEHAGKVTVAAPETVLAEGDLLTVVGAPSDLALAACALGSVSPVHLELDRSSLDFRRVFVSNPAVVGVPLGELRLGAAVVTRVRRGDVELLAHPDLVLELGDRVRVVAPREHMRQASRLFGDSYRALAEVDVITFGVGIAVGLVLGTVALPLPGGQRFALGLAGGPLVAGLVLGRLGRTGPLVWNMPYAANLTLRQLGLVLFLAGVGSRAGGAFVSTLRGDGGLALLATGAAVTIVTTGSAAFVFAKGLGMPIDGVLGAMAGLHTQPAALAFATEGGRGDDANVAYATVYPLATLAKIVAAQLLLALLR